MITVGLENAKHELIRVNNVQIHLVSMGPVNDKTPILLLHGFPDFYYGFRYLMPLLAKEHRVIAIDQRGYNKSTKPRRVKSYRLSHLMKDVVEVIKNVSPSRKVVLVGHDWGGAVAWHVARCYPDHIEKLVILNCPPIDLLFKAYRKIPQQLLMSFYIFLFQLPRLPEFLFKLKNCALLRQTYKRVNPYKMDAIPDSEMDEYVKCFSQFRGMSGINYYRAAFRDSIRKRVTPSSKVRCPTLVLWGVNDFALHVNLTHYFKDYVDGQNLKLLYYPAGHFIQLEIPVTIAKKIITFMKME